MTTTITPPTADPNETLLTLLAEHADALAAGNTSTLLEVATLTLSERALFGIAEALHRALPGVEPNPEFLAKTTPRFARGAKGRKKGTACFGVAFALAQPANGLPHCGGRGRFDHRRWIDPPRRSAGD